LRITETKTWEFLYWSSSVNSEWWNGLYNTKEKIDSLTTISARKKYMSPSTQKWNPQRLYQWTENESNRMHRRESITTRQAKHTDWLTNNRDQRQNTLPSETVPNKERATQDTSLHIRGRSLTPTKYHSEP